MRPQALTEKHSREATRSESHYQSGMQVARGTGVIPQSLKAEVVNLFHAGFGKCKIARILGLHEWRVDYFARVSGLSLSSAEAFEDVRKYRCPECGNAVAVSPCVICAARQRIADRLPPAPPVDEDEESREALSIDLEALRSRGIAGVLNEERGVGVGFLLAGDDTNPSAPIDHFTPAGLDPWDLFPDMMEELIERRKRRCRSGCRAGVGIMVSTDGPEDEHSSRTGGGVRDIGAHPMMAAARVPPKTTEGREESEPTTGDDDT